jgi:hypothetical protein
MILERIAIGLLAFGLLYTIAMERGLVKSPRGHTVVTTKSVP